MYFKANDLTKRMSLKKMLTKFNSPRKKKNKTMEEDGLVNSLMSPVTEFAEDSGAPTCHDMKMTNQFVDPSTNTHGPNQKKIFSILEDVLMGKMEPNDAAEALKQWTRKDGITDDENKGCISYSQEWLNKYIRVLEMFLDNNFPTVQNEYQPHICEHVNNTTNLMFNKITSLAPVLEDTGLLSYLIVRYNYRMFAMLDLLLDKSSSVKDIHFLLQWTEEKYLRQNLKGCSDIKNGIFQVPDPFLMASWFKKSQQKYIECTQNEVTSTLQNILLYDDGCDFTNEEDFIQVQLDIIQCLAAHIQTSTTVSQTLEKKVQAICCNELHNFVQRVRSVFPACSGQYSKKVVQEGTVVIDAHRERRLDRVVRSNIQATVAQSSEEVNAGSERKVSEYTVHHSCRAVLSAKRGTNTILERYMITEEKRLKAKKPNESDLLYLFRIIYTCMPLRSYALSIINQTNETDSSMILMLESMEDQALSKAQQCVMSISEEYLKKYFNKEEVQIFKLKETLQKKLTMLPGFEQLNDIKKKIVSALYQSVNIVYMRCLTQSRYKDLEKRWSNVEKRMTQDAEVLLQMFTQLNGSSGEAENEYRQKMLLLEMIKVLECKHEDSLILSCMEMYCNFFKESKEFLPVLLRWRGELSKQKIMRVLNVSREVYLTERPVRSNGLNPWCCWLRCA